MADPQYTDAQLSDGTTLRFNGQLDPGQVKAKVAAYRSSKVPPHHGASSAWGPEFDAPKSDTLSKLGAYVPEAATGPLAWAQQHYVQPTEKYLSAASSAGRELGRESLGMGSDPNVQKKYGMEKSVPLQTALGAAGAVGSVAATTVADPRNWPLMASSAARPLLQRLMSTGFGLQMGKGAIESTKQLYENWDKLTPEQRAELGTSAGLSTLMARASVQHVMGGGRVAADAAISPGSTQHTQAQEAPPPKPDLVTKGLVQEPRLSREVPPSVPPKEATPPVGNLGTPAPGDLGKAQPQPITPPQEELKVPAQKGEVVQDIRNYPGKETMAFRGIKKLEYSQRDLRTATRTGDKAQIDAAQQRVVQDASDWAKYAKPEEVTQAMQRLHNNASLLADQIEPMQALNKGLFKGKVSFREVEDPSVQKMSRADFRKIAGTDLPKVPKDYVDSLPDETRNALPPKGRQRQEAISRLWATDFLEQRGKNLVEEFDRARELQAVIAKTRGLTPPTRESYFLAKNAQPAETTASAEVGREAAATPAPDTQPAQAAQATARPGEPVRPAKGPEITDLARQLGVPYNQEIFDAARPDSQAISAWHDRLRAARDARGTPQFEQALQEAKTNAPGYTAELPKGVQKVPRREPPSKAEAEASPLSIAQETNLFTMAQEQLRKELNREPTIPEVMARQKDLQTKLTGVDPEQEARVQNLTKRGVARGTAERMVKEQLAREREEAAIRAQQKARPGERGSLSFRRLQPMIGPLGPSPTWRLASFLDRLATLGGALERSPEEQRARDITRQSAADLALEHLRLEAKLKEAIDRHDADGKDEFRQFMDAGEGKIAQGPVNWSTVGPNSAHPQAPFMNVADVATAQELHSMFQERWQQVQSILDKEPGGIENYLAHLWKRPGMAKQTMARFFGRRPLEGNKIFLKQRFYEYASDGLDHGLEPITYNPIRLQLTALFQMDKFLAAHELRDMYKDAGLVKRERLSPDWQMLNDKLFQPQKYDPDAGGVVHYQPYWAPPDVAKIFNRYMDPGLRGNPTYDVIRQYGNTLNQINLGVSAYHGVFITHVAAASDAALGIEKIFNNKDFGGGLKDIVRGTVGQFLGRSAVKNYQLGRKIQAEAINPTGNAELQAYVDDLTTAGARFDQDPMYKVTARKLATAIKTGHPVEAVKSFVQILSKPIMEKYVPRMKLGIAANMMHSKMEYLIKQGTTDPASIANELGKIWDSVDNRAGQMVYDNLFWNKSVKDISFLGVRAVGWDFGSLREGLGGVWKDPLQQAAKALRGERPEITPRMSFVAGAVVTMATLGAVTTMLVTGKPPQKLEDYFYPPSGRAGPDGKPERMSYPGYHRDAFSILHDVGNLQANTALHKAHPMINQVVEFLQNKDYYNTEIRSEGDPAWMQALQVGKWYGKSVLPFSQTMAQQRVHQGIPPLEAYGESFFGLQRAPSYVTSSPAEEMALDFSKRHWAAGPLTSRDREQRDTYNKFKTQVALGKLDTKAVSNAFRTGQLRPHDLDRLFEDQGLSSFQQEFKSLKLPEALKVMKVANATERQQLKPLLLDKLDQLEDFPVPEEQAYYQGQIQKYLQ